MTVLPDVIHMKNEPARPLSENWRRSRTRAKQRNSHIHPPVSNAQIPVQISAAFE